MVGAGGRAQGAGFLHEMRWLDSSMSLIIRQLVPDFAMTVLVRSIRCPADCS